MIQTYTSHPMQRQSPTSWCAHLTEDQKLLLYTSGLCTVEETDSGEKFIPNIDRIAALSDKHRTRQDRNIGQYLMRVGMLDNHGQLTGYGRELCAQSYKFQSEQHCASKIKWQIACLTLAAGLVGYVGIDTAAQKGLIPTQLTNLIQQQLDNIR